MGVRIVNWLQQRILLFRCVRLRRRLVLMRLDGEIQLLKLAKEI